MFSITFRFQLTWAHEQIWLKLHFQLTLLIPSRKLCVILITDTDYIISSSLAIEASVKIHQMKDMIIIIILSSFTAYTPKCCYHWNLVCEHKLFNILHEMHSEIKKKIKIKERKGTYFSLRFYFIASNVFIWKKSSGSNIAFFSFCSCFKWHRYGWQATLELCGCTSTLWILDQGEGCVTCFGNVTLPLLNVADRNSLLNF